MGDVVETGVCNQRGLQAAQGRASRLLGACLAATGVCLTTTGECLAEVLWPTRCIVCDTPGEVLCDSCTRNLQFIDQWRACPHCGAPFGRLLCTECNSSSMQHVTYDYLPFDGCVSAVAFDEAAARIVRGRKDKGERRLAGIMALAMARVVPPEWLDGAFVASVPATKAALRHRGFDHARDLAVELAALLELEHRALLQVSKASDQRGLARQERFTNMAGRFDVATGGIGHASGKRVLLADDVYTTGATLMAASETLMQAGFCQVNCVTFARVY